MNRQRGRSPGILLINPSRDHAQVGAYLFHRNARPQPFEQRQPAGVVLEKQISVGFQCLLHRHRRPKFVGPGVEPTKSRRRHANHREFGAVQGNTLSHNLRIRAELAPPQGVAQHHHGAFARPGAVRVYKPAAQLRASLQHFKVIAGGEGPRKLLRLHSAKRCPNGIPVGKQA